MSKRHPARVFFPAHSFPCSNPLTTEQVFYIISLPLIPFWVHLFYLYSIAVPDFLPCYSLHTFPHQVHSFLFVPVDLLATDHSPMLHFPTGRSDDPTMRIPDYVTTRRSGYLTNLFVPPPEFIPRGGIINQGIMSTPVQPAARYLLFFESEKSTQNSLLLDGGPHPFAGYSNWSRFGPRLPKRSEGSQSAYSGEQRGTLYRFV